MAKSKKKRNESLPIRSSAQIKEDDSRIIFAELIKPWRIMSWIERDFGIDAIIEVTRLISGRGDQIVTGKRVSVQLKSSDRQKFNGKKISLPIPIEKINYWMQSFEPVVLVYIDLNEKQAYYRWIDEKLINEFYKRNPDWVAKNSVPVNFSKTQKIDNGKLSELEKYILNWKRPAKSLLKPGNYFKHSSQAYEYVQKLSDLCSKHSISLMSNEVSSLSKDVSSSIYTIAIIGLSRTGKSTLINALLHREVSPVNVLPTTGIPITIFPKDENRAYVTLKSGKVINGEVTSEFLSTYTSQDQNPGNKKEVKLVRVNIENTLLERGFALCDVPGLDDADPVIRSIAKTTAYSVNAIIYVITVATHVHGEFKITDQNVYDLNELRGKMDRVFLVFNKIDVLEKSDLDNLKKYINYNRDGNSGLRESGLRALRQEIYRFSDFIFSATPEDTPYFLGLGTDSKEILERDYGGIKPCIHGSDAHRNSEICKPDMNRFTFIKAEPTFEGLRQILFEPRYRVVIGEHSPIDPLVKINSVKINFPESAKFGNEPFCFSGQHEIKFSPNFTCLIGGRGTGKSTILNLIHEKLKPGENRFFKEGKISSDGIGIIPINSSVVIDDDIDEKYIEFLSQNEVEEFAQDYQKLTAAIYFRILKKDERGLITINESSLKEKLSKFKKHIIFTKRSYSLKMELDQKVKEFETNKKIVDSFTSPEYVQITADIKELNSQLIEIRTNNNDFHRLTGELDVIIETYKLHESVPEPSLVYALEIQRIISGIESIMLTTQEVDYTPDHELFKQVSASLDSKKVELNNYLSSKGLTEENLKDISYANNRVAELEIEIEGKKAEIVQNQVRIDSFNKSDLVSASNLYKAELENQISRISSILEGLNNEAVKPISIKFEFDRKNADENIFAEFKSVFEGIINKNKMENVHRYQGDSKLWEVLYCLDPATLTDYESFMLALTSHPTYSGAKTFLIELFSNKVYFEVYKLICEKNLLNFAEFKKVKVQYDNRPLENSSFGQRCTAVLVILLLLGNNPIIIDEPEGHLDSLLISNYLVEVIKDRKQGRQIIFATHNANFAINGDAELIHILNTDNPEQRTTITHTTIENAGTRGTLIGLEGGKDAFLKRESKYQVH